VTVVGSDVPMTIAFALIMSQHALPDQLQVSEKVEDSGIDGGKELEITGGASSKWPDDGG